MNDWTIIHFFFGRGGEGVGGWVSRGKQEPSCMSCFEAIGSKLYTEELWLLGPMEARWYPQKVRFTYKYHIIKRVQQKT